MGERQPHRRIRRVAAVASAFLLATGMGADAKAPTKTDLPVHLSSVCSAVDVPRGKDRLIPPYLVRNRLPEREVSVLEIQRFKVQHIPHMKPGEWYILHLSPALEIDFGEGNKITAKRACTSNLPMAHINPAKAA